MPPLLLRCFSFFSSLKTVFPNLGVNYPWGNYPLSSLTFLVFPLKPLFPIWGKLPPRVNWPPRRATKWNTLILKSTLRRLIIILFPLKASRLLWWQLIWTNFTLISSGSLISKFFSLLSDFLISSFISPSVGLSFPLRDSFFSFSTEFFSIRFQYPPYHLTSPQFSPPVSPRLAFPRPRHVFSFLVINRLPSFFLLTSWILFLGGFDKEIDVSLQLLRAAHRPDRPMADSPTVSSRRSTVSAAEDPSGTEFYRVLPSFTEFYRVLPSFT